MNLLKIMIIAISFYFYQSYITKYCKHWLYCNKTIVCVFLSLFWPKKVYLTALDWLRPDDLLEEFSTPLFLKVRMALFHRPQMTFFAHLYHHRIPRSLLSTRSPLFGWHFVDIFGWLFVDIFWVNSCGHLSSN